MADKVRLFSNGTEYMDWVEANCTTCAKGIDNVGKPGDFPTCEIEAAMVVAAGLDGMVKPEIAARMGLYDKAAQLRTPSGDCTEWAEFLMTPDGKVPVAMARLENGLVWSEFMMLQEQWAKVHTELPTGKQTAKSPHTLFETLRMAGWALVEPVRLLTGRFGAYPGMVEFAYRGGEYRRWLNLRWYSQFYMAGLDVALSPEMTDIFVLLAEGQIVGAVMSMSPSLKDLETAYSVIWEDGSV